MLKGVMGTVEDDIQLRDGIEKLGRRSEGR